MPSQPSENLVSKELGIARAKKHSPDQSVRLLRQVEVVVASGKTAPAACREDSIAAQTYVLEDQLVRVQFRHQSLQLGVFLRLPTWLATVIAESTEQFLLS